MQLSRIDVRTCIASVRSDWLPITPQMGSNRPSIVECAYETVEDKFLTPFKQPDESLLYCLLLT